MLIVIIIMIILNNNNKLPHYDTASFTAEL